MNYHNIPFFLLHISIVSIIVVFCSGLRIKPKNQLHYCFLGLLGSVFLWNLGQLLYAYKANNSGNYSIIFVDVYFLGLIASPVLFLFFSLIFVKTQLCFRPKHLVLFIPPLISYMLLLTNDLHHLMFIRLGILNTQVIYGKYFYIHNFFNYAYIIASLYYLVSFSIRNTGFFSRQSLFIGVGILLPFITNILAVFKIIELPLYATPVMFTGSMLIFGWAIFKYQFLNVVPIALDKVTDNMTDAFVVIDPNLNVIDYNHSLFKLEYFHVNRKENLLEELKKQAIVNDSEVSTLKALIRESMTRKETVRFEKSMPINETDKHLEFEISPIFAEKVCLGLIFLIKDMTDHITHLEMIRSTQKLIERERLATLGELAAEVAHDINSPLSAVQTGLFVIENSIAAGFQEMDNPQQLQQLLDNMRETCGNTANACRQIVQIVNSIRNHTRNLSAQNIKNFYIDETIRDSKILLNHQLKISGCQLVVSGDKLCLTKGDPGKLSQVFTNLIINSIQAYDKTAGKIEINIEKRDDDILISVTDYAGGIDENLSEGIFKNIFTTKGDQGTGLGLYISHAIITGHFRGQMWFESKKGTGTTFFIVIPLE